MKKIQITLGGIFLTHTVDIKLLASCVVLRTSQHWRHGSTLHALCTLFFRYPITYVRYAYAILPYV